jgi:hypothetical protein
LVFSRLEFTIIKRFIDIRSHKLGVNNSCSYEKLSYATKQYKPLMGHFISGAAEV